MAEPSISLPWDIIIAALSALFALSGWLTVLYTFISDRPKLNCKVFGSIQGNVTFHEKNYTSFITYLYVTNRRRNAIHILDCEMEVEIDRKFVKLDRVYGTQNVQNYTLTDTRGQIITIPDIHQKWLFTKQKPVEFGTPLHSFVMFVGDVALYQKKLTRYRVTLIDAFYRRHMFNTKKEELPNLYLLADVAGIILPPQVGLSPQSGS